MSREVVCSVMCSFMLTFLFSPVLYMAWTLMMANDESCGCVCSIVFVGNDDDDEIDDKDVVE